MLSQMNCLYVKAFFDTNINKNVYPNNIECHLKLLVVGKTEIKKTMITATILKAITTTTKMRNNNKI